MLIYSSWIGKNRRQVRVDLFDSQPNDPNLLLSGDPDSVSVWRSFFVANEYSERQNFRRINVTFQLIFVLFLLKVRHSIFSKNKNTSRISSGY